MVFCKVEINSQGYKARLYSAPPAAFIIVLKLLINFDGNEAWPPIIKKFFLCRQYGLTVMHQERLLFRTGPINSLCLKE